MCPSTYNIPKYCIPIENPVVDPMKFIEIVYDVSKDTMYKNEKQRLKAHPSLPVIFTIKKGDHQVHIVYLYIFIIYRMKNIFHSHFEKSYYPKNQFYK